MFGHERIGGLLRAIWCTRRKAVDVRRRNLKILCVLIYFLVGVLGACFLWWLTLEGFISAYSGPLTFILVVSAIGLWIVASRFLLANFLEDSKEESHNRNE